MDTNQQQQSKSRKDTVIRYASVDAVSKATDEVINEHAHAIKLLAKN
ncbi:MAG TPA: hypothetical protein VN957_05165 [Chthoniobacterales bacterium]|jgi:hypothetical protein|nr:hypothetical protein [Chthoniobacterales bacterium]